MKWGLVGDAAGLEDYVSMQRKRAEFHQSRDDAVEFPQILDKAWSDIQNVF